MTGLTTLYGAYSNGVLTLHCGECVPCLAPLADRPEVIVGLEGLATWDVKTLRVVSFEVYRVTLYEDGPITEAFAELRARFGHYYDGLDVAAFMQEMRGDD